MAFYYVKINTKEDYRLADSLFCIVTKKQEKYYKKATILQNC